jgi:hypothetical protein
MPPKVKEKKDVLYVDGIHLGRKACVLICCDDKKVLSWYLCRDEHSGAWAALMSRIAEPSLVVSEWINRYQDFLNQRSRDEDGKWRYTHESLLMAERSLVRLLKDGTIFTYTDEKLKAVTGTLPATNNRIEGGVNARLREILREHRGLSIERRIKAAFWWCYMHSPRPLSASEILKVMPTDKSIADIYRKMSAKGKLEKSIPNRGDAVVWEEFHRSSKYPELWN